MQFIVLNEDRTPETFAEIFAEVDFGGESQKLALGSFRKDQLILKNAESVRIAPDCTCIFYENPDGSGKNAAADGSVRDLAELGFVPTAFLLLPHISCEKDGKVVRELFAGTYEGSLLDGFDTIRVPKMSSVTLEKSGGEQQTLTDGVFSVTELPCAEKLTVTVKGVILDDQDKELSYEELMQVAAGTEDRSEMQKNCIEGCSAQVCAANICQLQACPANACITNLIPFVGMI